ncbi:MAG: glycoside hydrolase family 16 protein [Bacteroidota bacterium]
MQKFLSLLFMSLLCTCGRAPEAVVAPLNKVTTDDYAAPPEDGFLTPRNYPEMKLVWEEEFTGKNLDTNSWNYMTGGHGWGNNELQYYRPENTALVDGNLVITARKEDFQNRNYTSSRLTTKDKREFKFGRIDIRAALPIGQGIWPALWMMGENYKESAPWPTCGEIDLMEFLGHQPDTIYGTAHYTPKGRRHGFTGSNIAFAGPGNYTDSYHVYSFLWEPGKMRWLVDNEPYFEYTRAESDAEPWPFDNEFFFLVNCAVGGNWPGNPDSTTVFPQHFYVDYIRVFQ